MYKEGDVLIVVDVQNDFVTGSLAVPGAISIIPNINRQINVFQKLKQPVIYTVDLHPEDHMSFKSEENPNGWPSHCVRMTDGQGFYKDLKHSYDPDWLIAKGTNREYDEYSAFQKETFDHGVRIPNRLEKILIENGLKRLYICGLATDYCVYNTVMDALKYGYEVVLLIDAIKGVDFNLRQEWIHNDGYFTDSEIAVGRMVLGGAKVI